MTEAELKSAQKAPVYMYYFNWRSPVHDGKLKAFHTLEIPFVTDNVDNGTSMTGTGAGSLSAPREDERGMGGFRAHRESATTKVCPTGRSSIPHNAPP